jgi:hypothetical protein
MSENIVDDLVEDTLESFLGESTTKELLDALDMQDDDREIRWRGKEYTAYELFELYKLCRIMLLSFAHNLGMVADEARRTLIISQLQDALTRAGVR